MYSSKVKIISLIFFISCVTELQAALLDTVPEVKIDEVILSSPRNGNSTMGYVKDTSMNADIFQPGLKVLFNRQPGLSAWNGENFAQDIRLSIRGFGARSAFGIRGVRMIMDGIPVTTPDGTTQPDELSPLDIGGLEVVRSSMAARLGNAAGGLISLRSPVYFDGWKGRASVNSLGSYMAGVQWGQIRGRYRSFTSATHNTFQGKRDHSSSETTSVYHKSGISISDKWFVQVIGGLYDSPKGDDPGALNIKEFTEDPYRPNPRNVQFSSGETVRGGMAALQSTFEWKPEVMWTVNAYYRKRSFEARLPFAAAGWVQLDRDFMGVSNNLDLKSHPRFHFSAGHLVEYQNDHRRLSENQNGVKGEVSADQYERVFNVAFYQQARYTLNRLSVHEMLRWDHNLFSLTDHFPLDGIENGRKNMGGLSAGVGFNYTVNSKLHILGNLSSNFETPTLNELTNNPNGSTGFNPNLDPEKSWQAEIGLRLEGQRAGKFALQIFRVQVNDQIQGYELPDTPGRQFYRNAIQTSRTGLEADYQVNITSSVQFFANYTGSWYLYDTYTDISGNDYKGNRQPLIPVHKINAGYVQNVMDWLQLYILWNYSGEMFLDDANMTLADDMHEVQISLTSGMKLSKKWRYGLILSNALNTAKYSNLRANAAGGRYYESASPRHVGINVSFTL